MRHHLAPYNWSMRIVYGLFLVLALLIPTVTKVHAAQACTGTVEVLFTSGIAGVQTCQSFSGTVTISVSGVGRAAGDSWSDAFYIYSDQQGRPITPIHLTTLDNFVLWINGAHADNFVPQIPPYNASHSYSFVITAPGGPLTFAVGDTYTADNSGSYTVAVTPGTSSTAVTLQVPSFTQFGVPWGQTIYDSADVLRLQCTKTSSLYMTDCGCSTTSAAMVLSFYGDTLAPDGSATTPGTVNQFLKGFSAPGVVGYTNGGVTWAAVADYSSKTYNPNAMQDIQLNTPVTYSLTTLESEIRGQNPVILWLFVGSPNNTSFSHFVVATGFDTSTNTVYINDPESRFTTLKGYLDYYPKLNIQMYYFRKTGSDYSALQISALAPSQVLVTDPYGNQTGFDPNTTTTVENVPNSVYSFDPPINEDGNVNTDPSVIQGSYTVSMLTSPAGLYTVNVYSPNGSYDVWVIGFGQDATESAYHLQGQQGAGGTRTLAVQFNPSPGSTPVTINSTDTTPPATLAAATSGTANYAFGTWTNGPVEITLTAADNPGGSGVAHTYYALDNPGCTPSALGTCTTYAGSPFPISTEGKHTLTYFSVDIAGNFEAANTAAIWIDLTPPSITITSPASSVYLLSQTVAAAYTCTDAGSGVASCVGPVANGASIDTQSVGAATFTVNAADNVGNRSSQAVPYVVAYNLCPLYDPSKAVLAGSTIPIKLQLCDAKGTNLSSAGIVVHALTVDGGPVRDAGNANPGGNFRYDSTLGGYIYNLQTTGLAGGVHTLSFTAGADPTIHTVQFRVK
jgi:uncharacterized protein YvpB